MGGMSPIGLDLAKSVLVASGASAIQVHAVDEAGRVVLRRQIRRAQLRALFADLSPCLICVFHLIGMAAGSAAHCSAREPGKPGHDARLMPPSSVKPCVKRGTTDAAAAEAICAAVTRPNLRVTPEAGFQHDAGQDRRAAIGSQDAQFEAIGARGIFWCVS